MHEYNTRHSFTQTVFFLNMINISCFLRSNREVHLLMLRNIYWCWGTWKNIRCAYYFFGFYKYGTNIGLSQLKKGSCKYEQDTPLPASRLIFIFFHKYKNRRDKYKNTDGTGNDFFLVFSSLETGDKWLTRVDERVGA